MHGIGVTVGRWQAAMIVGLSWWSGASQAAEPNVPVATMSPPVVEIPRPSTTDPFQKAGVIPTPFVPYAARGTDLDPVTRPPEGATTRAPTSPPVTPSPVATTPPAIDAGNLVPVNLPVASSPSVNSESTPKPRPRKTSKTGAAKIEPKIEVKETNEATSQPKPSAPEKSSSAVMTPIRPASISRDLTPSPVVEITEPSSPANPPKSAAPQLPTNFSFPQPVIPLESLLQRLLDAAEQRR